MLEKRRLESHQRDEFAEKVWKAHEEWEAQRIPTWPANEPKITPDQPLGYSLPKPDYSEYEDAVWPCTECGKKDNPIRVDKCTECKHKAKKWTCYRCTGQNTMKAIQCIACFSPRTFAPDALSCKDNVAKVTKPLRDLSFNNDAARASFELAKNKYKKYNMVDIAKKMVDGGCGVSGALQDGKGVIADCKFGKKCMVQKCRFFHRGNADCKFGADCRNKPGSSGSSWCKFVHPEQKSGDTAPVSEPMTPATAEKEAAESDEDDDISIGSADSDADDGGDSDSEGAKETGPSFKADVVLDREAM